MPRKRSSRPAKRKPAVKPSRAAYALRLLQARYDAAQTTDENRRHWTQADTYSARAANSAEVRAKLRARARYEVANNCYARGIVLTLANDVVGTGPHLQILSDDRGVNAAIEAAWESWSTAVRLAEKLRLMRVARAESGEAFGLLTTNPASASPVKLDMRVIEADQVADPVRILIDRNREDGIEFDDAGNPVAYRLLRNHPGDMFAYPGAQGLLEFDSIPAASMIHYFRKDRPGQVRGIPDLTPALPLFAQFRRYTLAVIAAAETAADFAAVLETDAPADGSSESATDLPQIEIERRMMVPLPEGWKASQLKAEQPATTYPDFKHELIAEMARCLNMPYNVAAGNSSSYNYASGRLDHQTYFKALRIERQDLESLVVDRLFEVWRQELFAVTRSELLEDFLPALELLVAAELPHGWNWDGQEHVDPAKEAAAQASRLASHTTTLAAEYARQGRDWETELRQRARELELMRELGLPLSTATQPTAELAPEEEE